MQSIVIHSTALILKQERLLSMHLAASLVDAEIWNVAVSKATL